MQIAKRWQLDPHHVLQRNPLALTADEEQWLQNNIHIETTLPLAQAPLSSRTPAEQFRGMAPDVLELITSQTGLNFVAHASRTPRRTSFAKAVSAGNSGATVRSTTGSDYASVAGFALGDHPQSAAGKHYGARHLSVWFGADAKNSLMKSWLQEHYPHLSVSDTDRPLDALRQLLARKVDAVIVPKFLPTTICATILAAG